MQAAQVPMPMLLFPITLGVQRLATATPEMGAARGIIFHGGVTTQLGVCNGARADGWVWSKAE